MLTSIKHNFRKIVKKNYFNEDYRLKHVMNNGQQIPQAPQHSSIAIRTPVNAFMPDNLIKT